MECPRVAVFDLDDTLAESFQPPHPEMVARLEKLLMHIPVAIMTGRDFARVEPGFLPEIVKNIPPNRLYIFPESTSQAFLWDGEQWFEEYSFTITDEDRKQIREAITASLAETGILNGLPVFGEQFIEKHAQTAFAALGLGVPSDIKYTWDPGNVRRKLLQAAFSEKLPDFDVWFGGATSIDVTKKGMNKAYGVEWLSKKLQIPASEMLYVGDALYEDGNDRVVIPTGIKTMSVTGPDETAKIIDDLLATCAS